MIFVGRSKNYEVFTKVRIHLVQTVFFTMRPSNRRLAFWRFGRNVRFVARREWLRLWPKVVVLPQISHFAIFEILSKRIELLNCLENNYFTEYE